MRAGARLRRRPHLARLPWARARTKGLWSEAMTDACTSSSRHRRAAVLEEELGAPLGMDEMGELDERLREISDAKTSVGMIIARPPTRQCAGWRRRVATF